MSRKRHFVPSKPFADILRKAIETREMGFNYTETKLKNGIQVTGVYSEGTSTYAGSEAGALDAVAFDVDLTPRRIYAIQNEQDFIEFDVADRIVTFTLGPEAWQSEPLAEFYLPLEEKDYINSTQLAATHWGEGWRVNKERSQHMGRKRRQRKHRKAAREASAA